MRVQIRNRGLILLKDKTGFARPRQKKLLFNHLFPLSSPEYILMCGCD
jgi:hypothetical protein